MVHNEGLQYAFGFISKTYRPLAQGLSWLGFMVLDPRVFPTSVVRQAVLQGSIYLLFIAAWWLIYPTALQRRVFAVLALVAGAVFFSGYVQLFHIYGVFYAAVALMLGIVFRFHASAGLQRREVAVGIGAIILALWHPFATALFLGYYFGFYIETFRRRSVPEHVRAIVVMCLSMAAVAILVVIDPTRADKLSLGDRIFGALVTYRANEVNWISSVVAGMLAIVTVVGMVKTRKAALGGAVMTSLLCAAAFSEGMPVLLVWLAASLIKLWRLRCFALCCLALAAIVLPLGGGIGTPIYGLFAIIVAVYATALGSSRAEIALARVPNALVLAVVGAAIAVTGAVRFGVSVPVVERLAIPLLAERERTYQLETVLAWLHGSSYCAYDVSFLDDAGNPIESVESVMTRRFRPPAALGDVQLFWGNVMRCKAVPSATKPGTAVITFGRSQLTGGRPVFTVRGTYAGNAVVWLWR